MIEKHELQKGLKVVYVPSYVKEQKYSTEELEFGIVSSWNDSFVFVKYDRTSVQATRYEDLHVETVFKAAKALTGS